MAPFASNRPLALVTGAGKKRIGYHVAEALARNGRDVAVHYKSSRNEATETVESLKTYGIEAAGFQADLTVEAEVERLIAEVLARFGRIDVLVQCASVWFSKRLEDATAVDVRSHFEANVLSTFLCGKLAGLVMSRQEGGGAIVNLGDWAEARPYLDYSAYFATKGAIPTLTRCLAVELADRNPKVRVNCILPGPVLLPKDLSEAERKKAIAGTLVQREGSPANVAQAVLALIDNDFVTGATLAVDGGRTIQSS